MALQQTQDGRIIKMQSIYEYLLQKVRSGYSHRKNNH